MDISALQQELMVAALSCGGNARTEFNDFQLSWKKTLQGSDKKMLSAFHNVLGAKGHKAYHTFKTKLATNAELRRIDNVAAYCTAAHYKALALNALIRALKNAPPEAWTEARRVSLRAFAVAAEQPDFAWPISACALQSETVNAGGTPTQTTSTETATEPSVATEETGAEMPPTAQLSNATAVSAPHQK